MPQIHRRKNLAPRQRRILSIDWSWLDWITLLSDGLEGLSGCWELLAFVGAGLTWFLHKAMGFVHKVSWIHHLHSLRHLG